MTCTYCKKNESAGGGWLICRACRKKLLPDEKARLFRAPVLFSAEALEDLSEEGSS